MASECSDDRTVTQNDSPLDEWRKSECSDEECAQVHSNQLHGVRLALVIFIICTSMLLMNLEIPIVNTALVNISNELGEFNKNSWIISSYLLGFVATVILLTKLSDIYGRKSLLITSTLLFVVFSGACGGAQTISQLIVFRAFQGAGGGAMFAISNVMIYEAVPPARYPQMLTLVSLTLCVSLVLGPVLGGVISEKSTWRWIFLLNLPAGAALLLATSLFIPDGFPNRGAPKSPKSRKLSLPSLGKMKRLDMIGGFVLLVATSLLVAAFEETGDEHSWKSSFFISCIILSMLCLVVLAVWERHVTLQSDGVREPIFPWRLMTSRIWMSSTLNSILLGATYYSALLVIPQRMQIVWASGPLDAGVRLIPFSVASPVATILLAPLPQRTKVPPIYFILLASVLQTVGYGLQTAMPASESVPAAQYGYEVIAGFGAGFHIAFQLMMVPFIVEKRDLGIATSSINQIRVVGGAIGVAVVTAALNTVVNSKLQGILSAEQITSLLQSAATVSTLDPGTQSIVRAAFTDGYNLQMKILTGLAGGQVVAGLLTLQRKNVRL